MDVVYSPVNRETNEPLTSIYANGNPDYPANRDAELNPVINSDSKMGGGYKKINQIVLLFRPLSIGTYLL